MTRPDMHTVPPFYQAYVNHVKAFDVIEALRHSSTAALSLTRSIPETTGEFRYDEGKWSIKELLCHVMDAERIFCYRALRFSRNDKTPLAGFEERDYAPEANAHSRTLLQLADEMQRLRQSTLDLFLSFTPDMLTRKGNANSNEVSVLMIGYIVAGHESHHCNVLKTRYLL